MHLLFQLVWQKICVNLFQLVVCEQAADKDSLPLIAAWGYSWWAGHLRLLVLLLSPDWTQMLSKETCGNLCTEEWGCTVGWRFRKRDESALTLLSGQSMLSPVFPSELVRVGYTFISKTIFEACYLGHNAVATFQQIKGYEQRDPAAQKLQI